jgi:TonB-linked SusC/RagA family outer membrane protein
MRKKTSISNLSLMNYLKKILLFMKLTVLFIWLSALQISATVYSHDAIINLKTEHSSFEEIIKAIEEQSEFKVFYKNDQINLQREVTVSSRNAAVCQMLDEALEGTDIIYTLIDKVIVLSPRDKNLIQEKTIVTGKITTTEGEELPGVNVVIKGTTIGTVTDADGNYAIEIPDEHLSGELQVSYIGYLSETIEIAGQEVINFTLLPDLQQLEEVVVVGYGVQKKSDLTGAVATVSGEKLTEVPVLGLDQALQGRAAGVSVIQSTGMPGAKVNIQIRGISSVNGTDPLLIVNGARTSDISWINPYDIESVEILKDASSAAIYGATGGNGVILITTKQGKPGKITTNFNYYRGWQKPWKKMDMMNSQEYAKVMNTITAINASVRGREYIPWTTQPDTLENYDWQDIMFRTAIMENYDLSVSGGNEKSDYYFSANYLKQDGILRKSDYDRMSFNINSNHKLNKIIKVGESVRFTKSKSVGYEEWEFQNEYNTPMLSILTMYPYLPPYDENGEWTISPFGDDNPKVWEDNLDKTRNHYRMGGIAYVDLNPFKGFTYTSKISGGLRFDVNDQFERIYHYSPTDHNDQSTVNKRIDQEYGWELQNYFNYNKTFLNNHNITLMAGHEATYTKHDDMRGERDDLLTETPEMRYFDASTNNTEVSQFVKGSGWEVAGYSYFGRINYDFKSKYLLTANIRNDYSSRFGPQYRSGVFPSFSVGWKFSEESFLENLGLLSFGKIRFSYGQTGANAPDNYAYYARIHTNLAPYNYPIDASDVPWPGAILAQIPNREMHWETMIMTNLGIDLGLFNNTLNITVDYFNKQNDGMLIYETLPSTAGIYQYWEHTSQLGGDARPISNIGKVINKGIEFTVGYRKVLGDLKASLDFNGSFVNNEVIDIAGDSLYSGTDGVNLVNICLTTEGYPIAQFNGFKTDGLFTWDDAAIDVDGNVYIWNQPFTLDITYEIDDITNDTIGIIIDTAYMQKRAKPGDFRFVDVNGDSVLNDKDRVMIGNPIPKFIIGFSASLEYKNFDLSLFFEGKFGQDIFNGSKIYLMSQEVGENRLTDVLNQYWDPIYDEDGNLILEGNTNTSLPRLDPRSENFNFARVSDFYVEDGSYLRLKNLQIGYTVPGSLTGKAGIEKFRVYLAVKNLITITKYTGFDPEVGLIYNPEKGKTDVLQQGIDKIGNYPHNRMFLVGVNLQF